MKKLSQKYTIKIFTTRNKLAVAKWLIENKIDSFVSDITSVKEPATLYINDRCICFAGDFEKTFNNINNFSVNWK